MHASNLFYTEPAMRLAERLAESSLGGRVFLCNSGTEANECAIKLARKHAHGRGIDEPRDRQLRAAPSTAARSARSRRRPSSPANDRFGPLLAGLRRSVPRDDAEALRAAVGERTAAVMIEPIQGEAGVYPIADEVLLAAREACDEAGALLIFDEIQTGMGRTGSLWAYEQLPVRPDVMTTRQGARRRAAGRRLRHRRPRPARCSSPATTARPSPAARSPPPRRWPRSTIIDDPALLRGVRELRRRSCARACSALDGVAEVRGRGLMVGVGARRRASTPPRSAPTCSSAAWSSTCPSPARCGCCRR